MTLEIEIPTRVEMFERYVRVGRCLRGIEDHSCIKQRDSVTESVGEADSRSRRSMGVVWLRVKIGLLLFPGVDRITVGRRQVEC